MPSLDAGCVAAPCTAVTAVSTAPENGSEAAPETSAGYLEGFLGVGVASGC